MSRKLKRVLHVGERRIGNGWVYDRAFYVGHSASSRAKRYVEVLPDERRHVVYDRDEETIFPGPCLWVVERYDGEEWHLVQVCESFDDACACRAFVTDRPTRLLRFVRRKERVR